MKKFIETTHLHYSKYIFQYGIITVIFLLETLEKMEEYEECKKIMDAVKYNEDRLSIKLHTRFSEDLLDEVIETYKKHNLTGKNVVENSMYCAGLIMNEITIE